MHDATPVAGKDPVTTGAVQPDVPTVFSRGSTYILPCPPVLTAKFTVSEVVPSWNICVSTALVISTVNHPTELPVELQKR